jgi:hypothetical protein
MKRLLPIAKRPASKHRIGPRNCRPKPFYYAHPAAGAGNALILEGIPGAGQHLDYSKFKIVIGR